MSTLIAVVIIVAFGALVLAFATRKKSGKGGKQKSRAQIIRDSTRKLAQDPHNADALIALGNLYYNERAWDKAYPIYETQISIAPVHKEIDVFKAALRQGICAVKLNKIPEAFKGLSSAVQINPNDFEVNYYLGLTFYKNNEFEKAVPRFKKAVVLKPETPGLNSPLGLSLYKAKHYKESLPYLKRALDENPENKEALFAMADGMNESGYGEKAMKVFMHLRPDPEFGAKACLAAGMHHLKIGEADNAIQDFEIGLKHQNATPEIAIETRYRLALAHFALKSIGNGISYLQEIMAINPQYKDVPQLLARYSELNQNKNLQTYLMASSSDFVSLCRKIVMKYYPRAVAKIVDISVKPENIEILTSVEFVRSEETHIFRFYRTTGAVADLYVREFHSRVSEAKADKGICISAGLYSDEGRKYAEGRPIDLIDKNGLIKILKKID
ncbi:tetratricopeptide repeat protein [uncultured Treponema sp.]|uniref:tetratricopeptide repeat protein n=1 Tax=uncultured Treponema sp. TaxID=162155 RepID=UPI0025F340C3|nr:tetratricopeptide repeat protein [uncultured Treponema sp.]